MNNSEFLCISIPLLLVCVAVSIIALAIALRTERNVKRLLEHLRARPHDTPQPFPPRPAPTAAPAPTAGPPPVQPQAAPPVPAPFMMGPPVAPRPTRLAEEPALVEPADLEIDTSPPPPATTWPSAAAPPLFSTRPVYQWPTHTYTPAAPAPSPASSKPAKPPAKEIRWEELIGTRVLPWVGIVAVLAAVTFFVIYAHQQGWFGKIPWMRMAIPTAFGLAILGAGEWFSRKKYVTLARIATGGGLTALYFSVFSGWVLGKEPVIPEEAVWPALCVITAVAIALAVRYSSLTIAILSLAGGLAAPLLIRNDEDPGHVLFLYDIAVSSGVLALAYFKKWRVLNLLALAGTVLSTGAWLCQFYWGAGSPAEKLPMIVTYFSILWLLYFLLMVVYHLLGRQSESRLDLPVSIVNVAWYFGVLYEVLRHEHHAWLGPIAASLGLVYLGQVLAMWRWAPDRRRLMLLQAGQAVALLTLAIPIHFDGIYIPMAWAVWAAVLFALGARWDDWRLRVVGLAVHVASLAALGYYAQEAWDATGMPVLNGRVMTFAVVAAAMAVSAVLYRRSAGRNKIEAVVMTIAGGIAHVTFMTILVVEVEKWFTVARAALHDSADIRLLRTLHDAILVIGFAVYGLLAVGLAAVVRRIFHHGMALVAFAASMVLLAYAFFAGRLPSLAESMPVLNDVGVTFGIVAACLAVATILARYSMGEMAGRRALAIAYELLAMAVVLGLNMIEISRWRDQMVLLGSRVPAASLMALWASGPAVMSLILVLRAAWIRSMAHRVAGLVCTVAAVLFLVYGCLAETHAYALAVLNPRGLAILGLVLALGGSAVVARYARGALAWREWSVMYELAAWTVALGLYVTELWQLSAKAAPRWPEGSLVYLVAAGAAVYVGLLTWRGFQIRSPAHRVAGLVYLGLAAILLLIAYTVQSSTSYETPILQARGTAYLAIILSLTATLLAYRLRGQPEGSERQQWTPVLTIILHAVALVFFTLEAYDFWVIRAPLWFDDPQHGWYARHMTLSVGYAVYGFALLWAGILRRQMILRALALIVLAGTVVKVFLFDLREIEAIWRVLSFLGLGLLLMLGSLLYYKYGRLIFPDPPRPDDGGPAETA
jgi:uncharacterized membrane protein